MENLTATIHYTGLYLAVVLISILFRSFTDMSPRKKRAYLFVIFSIIFVLMAFRSYTTGSDTPSYCSLFGRIAAASSPIKYISASYFEPGYITYNWLLSRITTDPRILFVVSAAFITFSLARFTYKYVDNPGMFCCLFIGMMQFDFFLSAMRQGIAIAILLFAFDFLLERKPLRFIILCVLASTFHVSAIVFVFIYPFFKPKTEIIKGNTLFNLGMVALGVAGALIFEKLISLAMNIFPRFSYFEDSEWLDGSPRMSVFLKLIVFILLLIVPLLLNREESKQPALCNAGKRLSVINLIVISLAFSGTVMMRLASTFTCFTTMHYSNEFTRIKPKDKLIMTIL